MIYLKKFDIAVKSEVKGENWTPYKVFKKEKGTYP